MVDVRILDDELVDEIGENPSDWLLLEESESFKGFWQVDCLDSDFFYDFEEVIGPYRVVSPRNLERFLTHAKDALYKVAFVDDPQPLIESYERLGEAPPFAINSDLEGTVNGLFPWQIRGFNKLVRNEELRGGLALWTTGAGKTAFIVTALKWHMEYGSPFDLALVVVKSNNKIDTQRKLRELGDIDSVVIDGTPAKRQRLYGSVNVALDEQMGPLVVITNYEKFRDDEDYFVNMVEDRRVLFFWDEMPTKLRNRGNKLYKAVNKTLYRSGARVDWDRKRPAWMRQWELSATPIENEPEDQFSCLRLIDPDLLGTFDSFKKEYASTYNFFRPWEVENWHRLDHFGLVIDHVVDQVDRDDPEVAKMYPKVIEQDMIIDWYPAHRKLYDTLTGKAVEMLGTDFSEDNVLALISVMQMVCDAPSMVTLAAERREEFMQELLDWADAVDPQSEEDWEDAPGAFGSEVALKLIDALGDKKITDDKHTKLETLRELLIEKHPYDKALVFTTWNSYGLPILSHWLEHWGISHVVYTGTGKQRQEAKDQFRLDPSIRVFLSSDAGSDSIDLQEASVGINYNLPYKWTTKRQRRGRSDRVNSTHRFNYWYDLTMADSVEDRKRSIIMKKKGYHDSIFKGQPGSSEPITVEDLYWMLTGRSPDSGPV